MNRAEGFGLAFLAVVAGGVGIYAYTHRAKNLTATPASSAVPANWTQQGYDYSAWTGAKAYAGSPYPSAPAIIGPGSGNQPNGVYYLTLFVNTGISGAATLSFMADDAAVVYIDGTKIASSYGCSLCAGKPVTAQVNLSAGTHLIAVQVANNAGAGNGYVTNGSGSPNPTGLYLTLTQSSQVVASTASANGWLMLAYPSALLSPNPMPLVGGSAS